MLETWKPTTNYTLSHFKFHRSKTQPVPIANGRQKRIMYFNEISYTLMLSLQEMYLLKIQSVECNVKKNQKNPILSHVWIEDFYLRKLRFCRTYFYLISHLFVNIDHYYQEK